MEETTNPVKKAISKKGGVIIIAGGLVLYFFIFFAAFNTNDNKPSSHSTENTATSQTTKSFRSRAGINTMNGAVYAFLNNVSMPSDKKMFKDYHEEDATLKNEVIGKHMYATYKMTNGSESNLIISTTYDNDGSSMVILATDMESAKANEFLTLCQSELERLAK